MTVQELIDKLQKIKNKNLRVVITGYEGGYDDVSGFDKIKIRLNSKSESYYGDHEEVSKYSKGPDIVNAIFLT
jgi:hypothetical protein